MAGRQPGGPSGGQTPGRQPGSSGSSGGGTPVSGSGSYRYATKDRKDTPIRDSRPLTDDELRAIIDKRFAEAIGGADSELRADRAAALDGYYGRPLGNEIDGRAQVVSKDMMDTIEWIMPSLLRVFTVQNGIQFDPVGPEDEELAKQETEYVSHVLWKKNPGFMILYCWLKDGLMQKNGYVKYWWQDEEKQTFDEYTGLTEEQLLLTMQDLEAEGEVTIVGAETAEDGTYSIKVKVRKTYGCAKIECVPPDEVIVSSSCRGDIKKANFVGHLRRVMRGELIEMGYDYDFVSQLTSYDWTRDDGMARDTVGESTKIDEEGVDWATTELHLLECETYVDADDDGVAELRHFLVGGNDLVENEESSEVPFESWTPIPVPHRHSGLSIWDLMEDLQRIHTALKRGLLDNTYFTMNPRLVFDKNTVDVASLQINRPGGHISNDGPPAGSVVPIVHAPIVGQLLPVIQHFDEVKETRTGVGRMSVGVDADVLAQSTKGAYMDAKGAANQRIEAIARIFAETGLSSLYTSLHRLLMRHQDWQARFKLKNDWVTVNPTEWQERANLTVSVGLGNASKEEIRANLGLMAQAQEKAAGIPGLIQPENVYALFRRMQTELGLENESFITDPKSPEYKKFIAENKSGEDPYITGEKIKADSRAKEKQLDAAVKGHELDQERDLEITKLEVQTGVDLAKAGIGAEVAVARGQAQALGRGAAASGKPNAPRGVPSHRGGSAAPVQGV